MKFTLEVCIDSYASALTAKSAGADRIEVCSALNAGGLTPCYGLIEQVSTLTHVEKVAMIRPRCGDFVYTEEELATMKIDVQLVKAKGFDGIVVGFLKADGRLDLERLKTFVELAKPMKVVLHRAFDCAQEVLEDMPALIHMGIHRVLSSGQEPTAADGAHFLGALQRAYGDQIQIMPGTGVTVEAIESLWLKTRCTHYHMSGKRRRRSAHVLWDEQVLAKELCEADHNHIAGVRAALDAFQVKF